MVLYSLALKSDSVELLCLFVKFGSVNCFAYLYSLVQLIVLLICTFWLCVLFCSFVQFGAARCFAYLYSLILCVALPISLFWDEKWTWNHPDFYILL